MLPLYLAPQTFKTSYNMSMSPLFLSATYNAGDKIGEVLSYVLIFLMLIEIIYVFVRFVMTSNK